MICFYVIIGGETWSARSVSSTATLAIANRTREKRIGEILS